MVLEGSLKNGFSHTKKTENSLSQFIHQTHIIVLARIFIAFQFKTIFSIDFSHF